MSERLAPQLLFDDGSRAILESQSLPASETSTQLVLEANSARASSISVSEYYEINRIASSIIELVIQKTHAANSTFYARVALQFPDELLCDAPEVCWQMEETLEKKLLTSQHPSSVLVFCLGDTTFGPCCPDEVAALHLNADVLVHYGHACLSHPAFSLPVIYGFGVTNHWDTHACVNAILGQAKQAVTQRLLLLYQVRYQHAMEDLQTQLSEQGDIFVVAGQIRSQEQPLECGPSKNIEILCCQDAKSCCTGTNQDGNEDKMTRNMNEELDAPQEQFTPSSHTNANTLANSFLLGGLEVSKDLDFSSFAVVFVGDQASSSKQGIVHDGHRQYINTILWYLSTKSKPAALWVYSPKDRILQTNAIPPGIQRQLNRRFYLIQKARDASIFGILIGTLSQRFFRSVVQTLRNVIAKSGRSSYTFAMGKVNPAKIANFAEIECFIMVACAETSWLDEGEQREMHIPIITPLELHMALGEGGPEAQWGECDYSLDYNDFLTKYPHYVQSETSQETPHSDEKNVNDNGHDESDGTTGDEDAPYFSLISGKYESSRKGSYGVPPDVDLTVLPGQGQLTAYKSEAAEFLKSREYQGLEIKSGETQVHAAVPGQKGIASKYIGDEVAR